jgi:hypothetical protein
MANMEYPIGSIVYLDPEKIKVRALSKYMASCVGHPGKVINNTGRNVVVSFKGECAVHWNTWWYTKENPLKSS